MCHLPEDHLIFLHKCDGFLIECVIDLKFFVECFDVFFFVQDDFSLWRDFNNFFSCWFSYW